MASPIWSTIGTTITREPCAPRGALLLQGAVEQDDRSILQQLAGIGSPFTGSGDTIDVLDHVLREARRAIHAEAGTLYTVSGGDLEFVLAQNDRVDAGEISRELAGTRKPVSRESLSGFVAETGIVINVPDARNLPEGTPFRIASIDKQTGYRTRSILAAPLPGPDGTCLGVVELFNCIDADGNVVAFPEEDIPNIEALASVAAVAIHNIRLQEQLKSAHLDTIIRLSVAAEYRDDDTAAHIRRISVGSAILARSLRLPGWQVELIEYASPMHDIGKIGIPDSILRKDGALTPEERAAMQQHTLIGAKILENPKTDVIAMAREVALSHHERWDGLGYPYALAGEEIPLPARVVSVADVFDALLSKRCYKEAYPFARAVKIIRENSGKHFDPRVVQAFENSMPELESSFRRYADES